MELIVVLLAAGWVVVEVARALAAAVHPSPPSRDRGALKSAARRLAERLAVEHVHDELNARWCASVPALRGVVEYGHTRAEAEANVRELARVCLFHAWVNDQDPPWVGPAGTPSAPMPRHGC